MPQATHIRLNPARLSLSTDETTISSFAGINYCIISPTANGITLVAQGGEQLWLWRGYSTKPILIGTWRAADWAISFYEKHGFCLVDEDEKTRLLKRYWRIPDRQAETSVVL